MLAILGAVFSSFRIYLLIGTALAAAALFAYVEYLRADAANARAALSTAEATINEATNVINQDAATIDDLQKLRALDQKTLVAVQQRTLALAQSEADIKEAINAIPEPKTCQALDPRDRAAIDGVRRLLAAPAAAHPNENDKRVSPGGSP